MNDLYLRHLSSSAQRIYEALRNDIVFGRLHPLARLIEFDLVKRFETNRSAVREAIRALERTGLVEHTRNKGALVCDLSPQQVEQIYSVRLLLETAAALVLPLPMPKAQLEELVSIQGYHAQAVDRVDLRAIFESNSLFHRTMYGACGNLYLVDLIEQMARRALIVRFHPYADRSFREQVRDEHWAMIEAIRECDRERLVALIREHVPRAKQSYLNTYDELVGRTLGDRPAVQLSRPR